MVGGLKNELYKEVVNVNQIKKQEFHNTLQKPVEGKVPNVTDGQMNRK